MGTIEQDPEFKEFIQSTGPPSAALVQELTGTVEAWSGIFDQEPMVLLLMQPGREDELTKTLDQDAGFKQLLQQSGPPPVSLIQERTGTDAAWRGILTAEPSLLLMMQPGREASLGETCQEDPDVKGFLTQNGIPPFALVQEILSRSNTESWRSLLTQKPAWTSLLQPGQEKALLAACEEDTELSQAFTSIGLPPLALIQELSP